MKKINSILLTVLLSSFLLFSCDEKEKVTPAPLENKSTDQSGSSAVDAAMDDVNDYVNNKIGGGSEQRTAAYDLPCGVVSIDSTIVNGKKKYTFKYGGQTPCGYKYKSGEISFQLQNGSSFGDVGAVFITTFTNYTVEVRATGDIVKVNGNLNVTNVDGGYIWQAITQSAVIKHKVRGKYFITYTNNEVRERNYFQLRTWSSTSGWSGLTFKVAGDTVINSINISEIGKTVEGNYDFQTQILNDFIWSNCGSTWAGPYVLKAGKAKWDVTVPNISPAYYEIEAGHKFTLGAASSVLVNDCQSNAYKIITQIGNTTTTTYQLY